MPSNSRTQIRASLPYCLAKIDSRFFKLNDGDNSKIRFNKVGTFPNRRTADAKNIETIRDRWGVDSHSDAEIYTDKVFSGLDDAQVFALRMINEFVKTYRFFDSEAVHLVPITREDLFGFDVTSDGHGMMSISFAGGIRPINPLATHQISSRVEEALAERREIAFWDELLLNSEQYIYQTDYRHSILEAVIALELVVAQFIRKISDQRGINTKDANEFIKTIGNSGNIKVTLKLLLDSSKLPDNEILEKCKAGITIRNNIVHAGLKEVNKTEAEDTLKYSKKLIEFLTPLF